MTHPIYRVSSLGRPIDPRFGSNIAAVAGSAIAGLAVVIHNLVAASPLASSPLTVAVSVFIAWATGRELDPDRPSSAMLAMLISFVFLLSAPAELMLGVGVLLTTRVISGTVGAPLRDIDRLALVALAGMLGAGGTTIVALPGLLVAGGYGGLTRRKGLLLIVGMIVAAAVSYFVVGSTLSWVSLDPPAWVALGLTFGALLAGSRTTAVVSVADLGGSLSGRRIRVSRWIAAAAVVFGFLAGGASGVTTAFPTAGAAVVATSAVGFLGRRYDSSTLPTKERVSK